MSKTSGFSVVNLVVPLFEEWQLDLRLPSGASALGPSLCSLPHSTPVFWQERNKER